jgi:hypothetical protein
MGYYSEYIRLDWANFLSSPWYLTNKVWTITLSKTFTWQHGICPNSMLLIIIVCRKTQINRIKHKRHDNNICTDKDGTIKFIIITRSPYLKVYYYTHFRIFRNRRYYCSFSIITSCNLAYLWRRDILGTCPLDHVKFIVSED